MRIQKTRLRARMPRVTGPGRGGLFRPWRPLVILVYENPPEIDLRRSEEKRVSNGVHPFGSTLYVSTKMS
jgi:hypothetical protein